jgi:hypothetical protein
MFSPLVTVSLISEYMNIEHAAGTEERARDTGVNEEKRERLKLTNRIILYQDFSYFFDTRKCLLFSLSVLI